MPLKVKVSETATQLSFDNLEQAEKSALTHDTDFDPDKHEVYKFVIIISNDEADGEPSRKQKRQSYQAADRVLVNTRRGSNQIEILGIIPPTIAADGQHSFDFLGVPILDKSKENPGKLMVIGRAKNFIKKNRYAVYASRTVEAAQWVFTKPYISKTSDFDLQLLCLVPKTMAREDRICQCDVTISESGRSLCIATEPVKLQNWA